MRRLAERLRGASACAPSSVIPITDVLAFDMFDVLPETANEVIEQFGSLLWIHRSIAFACVRRR